MSMTTKQEATVDPMADRFLTTEQLGAWLNVSRKVIDHLIDTDPRFPAPVKLGQHRQSPVRHSLAEVLVYLAKARR